MAKIAYSKLNVKIPKDIKELEFNNQIIEVKQYLPLEEKTVMIEEIVNLALSENRFRYNPILTSVYENVKVITYYTNITFTENQKNDIIKLYDGLVSSGLLNKIYEAIPTNERNIIKTLLETCLNGVYNYNNSVRGILDDLSTDYSNLNFDALSIKDELAENSEELKILQNLISNND